MRLQTNHEPRVTPPMANSTCRHPDRTQKVYQENGSINPGYGLSTHNLSDERPCVAESGACRPLRRDWTASEKETRNEKLRKTDFQQ